MYSYTAVNLSFLCGWIIEEHHWCPARQKSNNIWQLKRSKIIGGNPPAPK